MAFPLAPSFRTDNVEWDRDQSRVLNGVMLGKTNNTGTVTLTANAGSTTLTLAPGIVGTDTQLFLFPKTANAAAEIGAGTLYISGSSVTNNTFTITHANNAQIDRTYSYQFVG